MYQMDLESSSLTNSEEFQEHTDSDAGIQVMNDQREVSILCVFTYAHMVQITHNLNACCVYTHL